MKVGFSGTQEGLTTKQYMSLKALIQETFVDPDEAHHGTCIGADVSFHKLAVAYWPETKIHKWPANDVHRDKVATLTIGVLHKAMPALTRNITIANQDLLIAAPNTMEEVTRSGTWSTVRRARQFGTPIIFVWPDGKRTQEKRQC